ncbi:site-specific DNA-methyltransferase [Agromyces sp. NBRC 114283]|uniref:DNA-methyltransferase n=1 Tax=Agromyces sp. NBRC 114283 TaxID=2994521 RepID=UPI0025546159|nr:site-specific DNA-methyltransferase [Agromyces sp. NBRC 114283]
MTLYNGDCLEVTEWLSADTLVTDPPYGMGYYLHSRAGKNAAIEVAGDQDTTARDAALALWGKRPALVFGSWRNAKPKCDQVLIWDKGDEASLGHPVFFSAFEEVYVIGTGWTGPRRSNVIRANGLARGGAERKGLGHPTPKPVGLMELLVSYAPGAVIADPFAGSGATLLGARNIGRKAIGVELEERYCELIAKRLAQQAFDFGNIA